MATLAPLPHSHERQIRARWPSSLTFPLILFFIVAAFYWRLVFTYQFDWMWSPDLADQILGARYGYRRPAGGFCVWLDVSAKGGDEAATIKLYRDAGVRLIPGSYLARQQPDGSNPGAGYIRLALVADSETTAEALHRLVQTLG